MPCGFPSTSLTMPFPTGGLDVTDPPAPPAGFDLDWAAELGLGSVSATASYKLPLPMNELPETPGVPVGLDYGWGAELGITPPKAIDVDDLPLPTIELPEQPTLASAESLDCPFDGDA